MALDQNGIPEIVSMADSDPSGRQHLPPVAVRIALLREAVARHPTSAAMRALSGALFEAGSDVEAAARFREAYLQDPSEDLSRQAAANPDAVMARTRSLIAHGAGFSPVIAALAIALARVRHDAELASLVDHARLLAVRQLPAVEGWPPGELEAALTAEILGDLTSYDEPPERAIRHAMRNDRLLTSATPVATAFRAALESCVRDYINGLAVDSHPFAVARPADWVLEGWAVVSTERSHHHSHIHPRAWMSGVYYLVRPDVSYDVNAKHGWLRVAAPTHLGVSPDAHWPEQWIEPVVGRAVLMPAYFFIPGVRVGVALQSLWRVSLAPLLPAPRTVYYVRGRYLQGPYGAPLLEGVVSGLSAVRRAGQSLLGPGGGLGDAMRLCAHSMRLLRQSVQTRGAGTVALSTGRNWRDRQGTRGSRPRRRRRAAPGTRGHTRHGGC